MRVLGRSLGASRRLAVLAVIVVGMLIIRNTRAPRAVPTTSPTLSGRFAAQPGVSPPPVIPDTEAEPLAATTQHLRLAPHAGSYSQVQAAALAEPLETAITYVEERTGMRLRAPVKVIFGRHPESCSFDAVADTQRRTITMYACPDLPLQRVTNILAHEFVHQLAHDHYGDVHLAADRILSEGLATWGAGAYWLSGASDFRHFVNHNYRGALLPLGRDYATASQPDAMNRAYYEWAAFVEWIITTHGQDAFDRLYRGNTPGIGTAPYGAVLGVDLTTAEQQWIAWLDASS